MIVEKSIIYAASNIPVLLQIPFVMVTMLTDIVPCDGSPVAITKRGSKFLCTYNGLKTVPSAFKQEIDAYVGITRNNGEIHAPFVTDTERITYGSLVIAKLSSIRSMYVKRKSMDVMVELGYATDIGEHVYVATNNGFTKYHTR